MAWREIRPAFRKFLFMIGAIALGVGAVTGIKGFSEALNRAMLRSARDLIASDLAVRVTSTPTPGEQQALDSLVRRGARLTRVTETLSMASEEGRARPVLSNVKAVEPAVYPFYGKFELDPDMTIAAALDDDSAVVSPDFLIRTGARVGSLIQIGTRRFKIRSVLMNEPDRLSSGVDLGPRILITRAGLEQAGLIQFGSRSTETYLYRLPETGLDLDAAREILKGAFRGRVRISDYRDPNPSLTRGLSRMTNFLSLVGLLALLVGGLGVAMTVHSYLQQKLDSIAILKSLGARSSQVIRIYLFQGLIIGLLGSLLGVAFGYLVQVLFPPLLRGLLDLPTEIEPAPAAAVQGFALGVGTTLLFLLPPLLAVRNVSPIRIFLREMPETRSSVLKRLKADPLPFASVFALLAGIAALASWLADSVRQGFGFMVGLTGAILILAMGAKVLLFGLRRIPRPASLALRHGLRNLNRPGSHVAAVLVALGIGVAFSLTIYYLQTSLLSQIQRSAPADYPNLFLLGITERDKDALWKFLSSQTENGTVMDPIPAIPARLQSVDGMGPDQLNLEPSERRFFNLEFSLTWNSKIPPDTRITEGRWWSESSAEPEVSVGREAARRLRIRVGSAVVFLSSGRRIAARVVNIREVDFDRPGTNNQFIFSPGSLAGLPASYVGGLRIDTKLIPRLQASLFERFPNVTSVDVGQIFIRIQDLLDRISNIIRFIALFSILAGVIILASSVAATRFQRIRESVLLKTLGATRAQVARIQASEFLIVGTAAGLIGCLLAAAAADYLLGKLLETEFEFQWLPVLIGTVSTALLAILTGWIASRGVLNHKPLEILREN